MELAPENMKRRLKDQVVPAWLHYCAAYTSVATFPRDGAAIVPADPNDFW